MKTKISKLLIFVLSAGLVLFFNEYLIFHIATWKCEWDCGEEGCSENDLKSFMISDTHLLGKLKGHWLDKLKREWQMYRSFQSAVTWQQPDTVFFLGDLMDEGQWAGEAQFHEYSERFRSLFGDLNENGKPKIISLAGNHDLGFHYAINPNTVKLFKKEFKRELVDEIHLKGHRFILITSMALHGDGCQLCHEAEIQLAKIKKRNGSRPIVLQHFPLFRKSDAECDILDKLHEIDYEEKYKDSWDTLSRDSTYKIIENLKPKAVFAGHTHKMCKKRWNKGNNQFYEYTINSFSWRNGARPAFLMVVFKKNEIRVSSCRIPSETAQIYVYILFGVFWEFALIVHCLRVLYRNYENRKRSNLLLPCSSKIK